MQYAYRLYVLAALSDASSLAGLGLELAINIAVSFIPGYGLYQGYEAIRRIAIGEGGLLDYVEVGAALAGHAIYAYKAAKYYRAWKFRNAIETHHLLPIEFLHRFEAAGLKVDDYVVELRRWKHRLKPHGIHTGQQNWNRLWREFIDGFDRRGLTPTRNEMLDFLAQMRREFGV